MNEQIKWGTFWTLSKRRVGEATPYRVERIDGNMLLSGGANAMLRLLAGAGGTVFGSGAYLGVGDGVTAANAAQTGLQGDNTALRPMDADYPAVAGNAVTYKATFGETDGNFDWNEFCVMSGNGGDAFALNRKVSAHGVKPDNEIWYVLLTVTLA